MLVPVVRSHSMAAFAFTDVDSSVTARRHRAVVSRQPSTVPIASERSAEQVTADNRRLWSSRSRIRLRRPSVRGPRAAADNQMGDYIDTALARASGMCRRFGP